MHQNLRTFIESLRKEDEIVEISSEVDPYLEIAEIHRRVIESQGKALLFTNVKGSTFPVATRFTRVEAVFVGLRAFQSVENTRDRTVHA